MPATDNRKQSSTIQHIEDATTIITLFLIAIKNFIFNDLRAPYLYYDVDLEISQDKNSIDVCRSKAKCFDST